MYEIRVAHAPSDTLAAAVPEMRLIPVGERSLLMGNLYDHGDLQSVLARLSDMGIEIEEFRKLSA